ncbi:hypothetical protein MOQ72_33480 [Saccharopolyspora sp. K220]|uniref:hypothetical protein n=1 Tax=Saccharopolyspora soli TaxID=2926618 RepID=UPI001F562168|nr:hypothetical protein [Saccharopolyspora soli]MCI2422350.1 hypothetical protein [Saccharopolyspora soli]
MYPAPQLSVDEASRLAVAAVAADLEHWACSVACGGQIELSELIEVLGIIRTTSIPRSAPNSPIAAQDFDGEPDDGGTAHAVTPTR